MTTDESTRPTQRNEGDEVVIIDNFNINHDPEDLVRFKGRFVAWSRDGRKVLFSDPDPETLFRTCAAAGLQPEEYVLDGIPAEDCFPEFGWEARD
jgi:hypothetical protein